MIEVLGLNTSLVDNLNIIVVKKVDLNIRCAPFWHLPQQLRSSGLSVRWSTVRQEVFAILISGFVFVSVFASVFVSVFVLRGICLQQTEQQVENAKSQLGTAGK